jgi:hypothetical protein
VWRYAVAVASRKVFNNMMDDQTRILQYAAPPALSRWVLATRVFVTSVTALLVLSISFVLVMPGLTHFHRSVAVPSGRQFGEWGCFGFLTWSIQLGVSGSTVYSINWLGVFWTVLSLLAVWLVAIGFLRSTWRAAWPGRLDEFMREWWRTGSGW